MSAPRSIQEKNEYLAKLELLKRNIEEERARNSKFEQTYPSNGTIIDTFESAAARERDERRVQEMEKRIQLKAMQKAYEQAQEGNRYQFGFTGFKEAEDKSIVASNTLYLNEAQQLMLLQALGIQKAKEIEKPAEIISPLTQQDREILI